MAQTFTDDCYAGGHAGKTDLQNIETNFAAVKSSFAGTSAPSNIVGGMPWHDSTARKVRNYANTAWLISLLGDAQQKMWVYRNNTCEGWLVSAEVSDRVLAVKGGGTSYNVSGGAAAGTWTISGISIAAHVHSMTAHVHKVYDETTGQFYNSSGTLGQRLSNGNDFYGLASTGSHVVGGLADDIYTDDAFVSAVNTGSTIPTASHNAAWRPAAAVGTLQYPDLS